MPNIPPPKVCVRCKVLREPERFRRGPKKLRIDVCVFCEEEALAPKACRGCGEMTPLDEFKPIKNGKRSVFCNTCHAGRQLRKCTGCKEQKPKISFHVYESGQRSRTCDKCRRALYRPKVCRLCKKTKITSDFHRYRNSSLSDSCNVCRKPQKNFSRGPNKAPQPCLTCGKEIWAKAAPSKLRNRKTCSPACRVIAMQAPFKNCKRCKQDLPVDNFDKTKLSRHRQASCRACLERDTEDVRGDLYRRPTAWQLQVKLRDQARMRQLPFGINSMQARVIHRSPCELCGKATSAVSLKNDADGYVIANCRPVCRICNLLLRRIGWAELVLLSNEISARHRLDA